MIKAWANSPLSPIPKEKRLKRGELGICKGGCNCLTKIQTPEYQTCEKCSDRLRYLGAECDVPNCESVADGDTAFFYDRQEAKIVCNACKRAWQRMNKCQWERFVEERHLFLARPSTFVKALEEGLVSVVENPVSSQDIAKCHFCYDFKPIANPKYQLCNNCSKHLQFHGESCSISDCDNDATTFDTNESRYVCTQCRYAKTKYKIASYHIYETQVRPIKNCMICEREVSHNIEEGTDRCSALIDHDHDTGDIRGILCHECNTVEGQIKKMPISPHAFARRLVLYLENPPLSKSWMKK